MADLGIDLWDEDARDRLEKLFWRLAQELLVRGQSVILESGFWLRSDRDEKRLGARALGVPVELHFLDVHEEELARRLESRLATGAPDAVPIKRKDLDRFTTFFQPPDALELAMFDPQLRRGS